MRVEEKIYLIEVDIYEHQDKNPNRFSIKEFRVIGQNKEILTVWKERPFQIAKTRGVGVPRVLNKCDISSVQGCSETSGIFYQIWCNDEFDKSKIIEHFDKYEQKLKEDQEGHFIPFVEYKNYLNHLFILKRLKKQLDYV